MLAVEELAAHYRVLAREVPLRPIRSEAEYRKAVKTLEKLLDAGGAKEGTALADLVAALGRFIADYEESKHPLPDVTGCEALRFLMTQHALTQSQLPEIGSQGVVSEILSGKRELTARQIKALARRFRVPPAVFL